MTSLFQPALCTERKRNARSRISPSAGSVSRGRFLRALGLIKACAAEVNGELGELPRHLASAIEKAADQVAEGAHDSQFVVDVFQTGSGTSTNMNANEVIAHLSNTHPNDHVNRSQSSNDVIPAAIHIAAAQLAAGELLPAMDARVVRAEVARALGCDQSRPHALQDAVPIRFGQEFGGYARQAGSLQERVTQALQGVYELPIGGTPRHRI